MGILDKMICHSLIYATRCLDSFNENSNIIKLPREGLKLNRIGRERSIVSEKWPDKRRLQFLKDRAAHYSRQPSRFPGVTTSRRPSLCDASFVRMCPAFVPILWIDTFPVFFTKIETRVFPKVARIHIRIIIIIIIVTINKYR